jgi:superfamily II DNA or RNA helicase
MNSIKPPLQVGQIVHVRQRQYLVEEVESPPTRADATLVRLACLDDDARGQELQVVWESEVDAQPLSGAGWDSLAARGFDPPQLFSAYLHTLRWNCVTATNPRLFQSPFRAGIRLDAYQLEPLRKALLLPRVNLFIADDVGLGKTIEAGLIARELLLRKKVKEIVVACPPSVLPQWQDELEARFGLTFVVLDKEYITRIRRERGYGVNPWTTHARFLVSQRLLIDEAYTGGMRDWLGDFRPGSLLILDEAHHAAPSGGQRYAIDSKITKAVRDLAPRFEHRLFLSATPHNGHSNSFSALLEILDPQRFCRGVPVKNKKLLDAVMVRRLKEDLREEPSIGAGFPRRIVQQIDLDGLPEDAPELVLSRLLDQYRRLREKRMHGESRRKQTIAALLITGLQQRLLSSIEAFARTLRVHRRTVERKRRERLASDVEPKALDLLVGGLDADDERTAMTGELFAAEEDAQVEAATLAEQSGDPDQEEDRLLEEMTEAAEAARDVDDARIRYLIDWIRANLCPGSPPRWNDTRVLIFTEYEDTQRYLSRRLEVALEGTDRADQRIAVYSGPTPADQREEIKQAFNGDPAKYPLRILIATDAAREGINLQAHCWNLFHLDVPWNPGRMEQRNGRIDRKLQPRPEVFCHYFVYTQRAEDRVLKALVRKTETIKRELGSLSQVIEGKLATALGHGIRHADADRLVETISAAHLEAEARAAVEEELEAARDRQDKLRAQVDRLRTLLHESAEWVGFDKEQFGAALSCALEVLKADPLKPEGKRTAGPPRLVFPALDARTGADPTWADTLDSLRVPRRRDQKLWEWRREAPLRPVVFEDTGTMTEDVVHLHLEHRVVQRLLGRFSAQGFVHHDLSRACLAQSEDAIPRVVLIGRLCLYGPGAARLHEELIEVAARWIDPGLKKNRPLTPYAREAAVKAQAVLEKALLPSASREPPKKVGDLLRATAPRDVEELLPHLLRRGDELANEAAKKLLDRGEREAKDMREILEQQRTRIAATAAEHREVTHPLQKALPGMEPEEARQLEANRRHWQTRLVAIEKELSTEPERIRELYRVKARRVEPIGLVYLWPVTG